MDYFDQCFEPVKGYKPEKEKLRILAMQLKEPERFEKLGVEYPTGLLLYGPCGTGKSLMASCLAKASGYENVFVVRKNIPNNEFVNLITETFNKAKECDKALLIFEDLDRSENETRSNSNCDSYMAVQAGIDDISNKHIFVICTCNDIDVLPDSLKRKKRLSNMMYIGRPSKQDAEEIILSCLLKKDFVKDVDGSVIAALLVDKTAAELDETVNNAAKIAVLAGKTVITTDDIVQAFLIDEYGALESNVRSIDEVKICAYHEAGHTLMSIIENGLSSVPLVSILTSSLCSGITCTVDTKPRCFINDLRSKILVGLGGRVAVKNKYNDYDLGSDEDLGTCFELCNEMITSLGKEGIKYFEYNYKESEMTRHDQEQAVYSEMNKCENEVLYILTSNWPIVEKIANALIDKKTLLKSDLEKIVDESVLVYAA